MSFDPTSPTAEDQAFGALLTLESGQGLDQPTPAGIPFRDELTGTPRSYVETRRASGLPVFPNRTAMENRRRNTYLRDLYTKPITEILPAEAAAKVTERQAIHPDPEAYLAREINRTFLSATTGRNLDGNNLDLVRDLYAKQNLGLS